MQKLNRRRLDYIDPNSIHRGDAASAPQGRDIGERHGAQAARACAERRAKTLIGRAEQA
jgi:hypothetical protein